MNFKEPLNWKYNNSDSLERDGGSRVCITDEQRLLLAQAHIAGARAILHKRREARQRRARPGLIVHDQLRAVEAHHSAVAVLIAALCKTAITAPGWRRRGRSAGGVRTSYCGRCRRGGGRRLMQRFLPLPRLAEGVVDIGVVVDKGVGIWAAAVLLTLCSLKKKTFFANSNNQYDKNTKMPLPERIFSKQFALAEALSKLGQTCL